MPNHLSRAHANSHAKNSSQAHHTGIMLVSKFTSRDLSQDMYVETFYSLLSKDHDAHCGGPDLNSTVDDKGYMYVSS